MAARKGDLGGQRAAIRRANALGVSDFFLFGASPVYADARRVECSRFFGAGAGTEILGESNNSGTLTSDEERRTKTLSVLQSSARVVEISDCHEIVTVNCIKQAKIRKTQKTEIRRI